MKKNFNLDSFTTDNLLAIDPKRATMIQSGFEIEDSERVIKKIFEFNQESVQPFLVHINSDGGSFDGGSYVYDALVLSSAPAIGLVCGKAYSAALKILMGCDKKFATTHSTLLFHNPSNEKKIRITPETELAEVINRTMEWRNVLILQSKQTFAVLKRHTKLSQEEIERFAKEEKIFSASEALSCGMINEIISTI